MTYVVQKEHIWERQRILAGKKCSLRKTYRTQSEANDQVWLRNENTEQARIMMATFHTGL